MALKNQTSNKYLELKPEEANLFSLCQMLISGNLESKKFIDVLRVKKISLKRRAYICVSVVVQKALQSLATPMAISGSGFEFCLNFVANNEAKNILQGKMVIPGKESANYCSALGHLDRRVKLDKNISQSDCKYFPMLSVMASKISYENKAFIKTVVEDQWKMELIGPGVYDFRNEYQNKNTTQAVIIHDKSTKPDTIIVAFRGTEPFNADDWCTDFDISWQNFENVGKVHSGFMKALGLQNDQSWPLDIEKDKDCAVAYYTIREKLREMFRGSNQTRFILTGHSLGGALAVLFPAILALHEETDILERLEAIYTFGQPRVGDEQFGSFLMGLFRFYDIKYYRFVYNHDIVPRLPYDDSTLLFKHFGTCLYFNSLYEGKIVHEEPHRNYFCWRSFFTRRADVIWEIVRSAMLPMRIGPDYKECLLLRTFRLIGLLVPGLPAHGLQEYVNAVLLGDADLFSGCIVTKARGNSLELLDVCSSAASMSTPTLMYSQLCACEA